MNHYDAQAMRTTLTIDDDVAEALKALSRTHRMSFKDVVNDMLRKGIMTSEKPPRNREAFLVPSAPRGFRPGIDPLKLSQLADELEVDEFLQGTHRPDSDS